MQRRLGHENLPAGLEDRADLVEERCLIPDFADHVEGKDKINISQSK